MSKDKNKVDQLHLIRDMNKEMSANIFEGIVWNFPDIIHSVDENARIVSVNQQATQLLGYEYDELIGKSVFDIYADEVLQDVKKGFKYLKKSGIIKNVESKLKSKDGTVIDVEMRSLSLYDDDGKFVKTFTIIRDIRELNQLKKQIIQQSKLAGIGELASGIMHEIRNPLSVIMSYSNYYLKKAIESSDMDLIKKSQEKIDKAAGKIQKLTDHLRGFSRQDSHDEAVETVRLSEIIEDSLLMLEKRITESQVDLVNEVESSEVLVSGRINQIEQVLINLIGNACDAVKDYDKKRVEVSVRYENQFVLIDVRDFGPGIDERNREKIFDAFFTTKPKGVGTGLGLSICHSIIANHGGELNVSSSLGKGATFTIKLPKPAQGG